MKLLRRTTLLLLVNLAVLLLLAVLVEGGTSVLLFLRDVSQTRPLAERLHTVYDPELGWVNKPGVRHPDMYGPGIPLTINPQGFRGVSATSRDVAPGILRIVCTGDSFTLGYGVADEESWCHQLGALDPRLETVNMGQGGYGFDQAFLWYRRDGMVLEHQVQVFAFIADDFRRMQDDEFLGYAKPTLTTDGDSLRVANLPIPRGHGLTAWWIRNAKPLQSLRVSQLLQRWTSRRKSNVPGPAADSAAKLVRTRAVVTRILAELQRFHASRRSHVLLVLLPTAYELRGRAPDGWSSFLAAEASTLGIAYLDLFPRFRAMPEADRSILFLASGAVNFPSAAGHYTRAGNALVAAEILATLRHAGFIPLADTDPAPRHRRIP